MEFIKKYCSFKEHNEIEANTYCTKCQIYMCKKCDIFHSKLLQNHNSINLSKNTEVFFTGYCKEEKHQLELEFFCKTHNELCCAACISKIKKNEYGKHKDCEVYTIEDIKDENLKYVEELSDKVQDSFNNLKKILEQINKDKEDLNLKIQKIFTKIRNTLNNREDELILEIDRQFNEIIYKEDIIKDSEKLPEKMKELLEKGKEICGEINKIKLNSLINDYIIFENSIKNINSINDIIKKCNDYIKLNIKFSLDEEGVNNFLENLKKFGGIYQFYYLSNSLILANDIKKQECILNWIYEKTNKKRIKPELIFRMGENGSSWEDFHKYCDDKGPTLILIKTTKDKIFGGFTPLDWKKLNEADVCDNLDQTFIFSLNLMKKYDLINSKRKAIRYLKNFGPIFGDKDIALKII